MQQNISKEDIILIEKFIDIRNKGFYCDGTQVTEVYNRVLNKSLNPTNCAQCIRQRINELEGALNSYKRHQEALKQQEPATVPQEENKGVRSKKKK